MKIFFFLISSLFFSYIKYSKSDFSGIYKINSNFRQLNFLIKNHFLLLSNKDSSFFKLIKNKNNSYYIELLIYKRILGINDNNEIIVYKLRDNVNINKMTWNIIKIFKNCFFIQNKFNLKYIQVNNNSVELKSINKIDFNYNYNYLLKEYNSYLFNIIKIFDIVKFSKYHSYKINKEPIDIVMKYIDLTDKLLNRNGIKQIYKDKDNEELRYSLRSIFQYIPWIRKIFILMPNERVKYLKPIVEIKEKIIYIKDKDLLGYDSANIQSFLFNLDKMEKFGLSKNFIYFEDDYFVGKPLKKEYFFYYDDIKKKIVPNIITWRFYETNKNETLNNYFELYKKKDFIHAHSKEGFLFQILNTEKFFIDNYNFPIIIKTFFTHNAISENIDDLKEIHNSANKYIYINETLYLRERNLFSLCHEHYYNLYQLNVNHRKVNSILTSYIPIEKLKKKDLNRALFVINTGGNHQPLKRHYKIQKKIMDKRFPLKNLYEIKKNNKKWVCIKYFKFSLNIFILLKSIKIYKILI